MIHSVKSEITFYSCCVKALIVISQVYQNVELPYEFDSMKYFEWTQIASLQYSIGTNESNIIVDTFLKSIPVRIGNE